MAKIRLRTLKECLMFLEWLNNGGGPKKDVVTEFVQRLTPYFPQMSRHKIALQKEFFKFLKNVSSLYKKILSKDLTIGGYKVETGKIDDILEALLECIPKFLAALSFMQYHVDTAFSNVGGGDWNSQSTKSGNFQTFLTTGNNIIRGGFDEMELSGVRGKDLVQILRAILNKEVDKNGKAVHDHFRNVILTTLEKPWNNFNTGNTVSLVNVFCQLVTKRTEPDGGAFKKALEKGHGNEICWEDLKNLCEILKQHIQTLTAAGFSVIGRGITPTESVKFATEAADWFRENLTKAAEVLSEMIPHKIDMRALRSFAENKLYPHGFIFDGSKQRVRPKPNTVDEWTPKFQQFHQLENKLRELKGILDGTYSKSCQSLVTKTEATKTEAAKPVVTKAEAAKPTATKTEATKTEATKPHVQNAVENPDQNNGQSEYKLPGPQVVTSAPDTAPAATGVQGPAGSNGDRGQQGPPSPLTSIPSQVPVSQPTNNIQSPPSLPSAPVPSGGPGTPSDLGRNSQGSDPPTAASFAAPPTVLPSSLGVQLSDSVSSSVDHSSDPGLSQHSQQSGVSSTTTSDSASTVISPGQGVAPGDGEAAGGTDGDSQDDLNSRQPSTQLPIPQNSISGSTSSVGGGSPAGPALNPQSSSQINSYNHATGTSSQGTATVSQNRSLGHAVDAGATDPQLVTNPDNGSQGQPNGTHIVLAPPPDSLPSALADPAAGGKPGSKGHDPNDSVPQNSQSAVTPQPAPPKPPSDQSSAFSSSAAFGLGGGQLRDSQGSPSDARQPGGQGNQKTLTVPTITTSAAPGPASGGGGAGEGDRQNNGNVDTPAAPVVKQCLQPSFENIWKNRNSISNVEFCPKINTAPTPKYYDIASEQLWDEYKKHAILQPLEKKIEERKREKDDNEREKEEKRQLQLQAMLPEVQVVYKPQDLHIFDQATKDNLRNNGMDIIADVIRESPDVTMEVVHPTLPNKKKDDMPPLQSPDSLQSPLSLPSSGEPIKSVPDYIIYSSGKPKALSDMAITPAGFDGQSLAKYTPKSNHPGASKPLRHYLQNYGDMKTSVIEPVKLTHKPMPIMAIGQATADAKGIQNSMPPGVYTSIGIPKGQQLKPTNHIRYLLPVSDITTKHIPDRNLNVRLPPHTPTGKQLVPLMQPRIQEHSVNTHKPAVIMRDFIRPAFQPIIEYIEDNPRDMIDPGICPASYGNYFQPVGITIPPTDTINPSPRTVRQMLCWLSDLPSAPGFAALTQLVASFFSNSKIIASSEQLSDNDVISTMYDAFGHASSVLAGIQGSNYTDLSKFHFERYGAPLMYYSEDPYTLLCQLLSYVYATYHQLSFLRTQCRRESHQGGWRDCQYGKNVKASEYWLCTKDPLDPMKLQGHGCDASPLQGFLTDHSDVSTYWYQKNDVCRRSRIKMGFVAKNFRNDSKHGFYIYNLLTGACYNNVDPLEKLCRYLVCLTRRTPRTTGELVSFFHHFGNSLHDAYSNTLLSLGESLSSPHADCPDWDHLDDTCLGAVRGIRGNESVISKHNSNHDKEHPRTLSTLVGCGSVSANCHPHCSPITYRAYSLYSPTFAHTYLSWAVSLPDKLWESLDKLHYDLKKHVSIKCSSLYLCSTALPLLYTHGITSPEGTPRSSITCSELITKLGAVVNGKPIAMLITCMDDFLYGIREPFIFTLVALWSTAFLIFANTTLYRLDILHIRSHLIRSKASHRIDVKALLTKGRKMLSLYKDVDYFDEDPIGYLGVTH